MPEDYVASPEVLEIEQIAAGGSSEQRLITVRTSEGHSGPVEVTVVATVGESVVVGTPVSLESLVAVPLRLVASGSASAAYAGEAAYIRVTAENVGPLSARGVIARLIDVEGNLGVLVQEIGDIAAGQSEEWVFVAEIPDDYPSDSQSSFVVETTSADGMVSESNLVPLSIACRPRLELSVQPPTGRIRGGQALEAIVLVKNVGPCTAREAILAVEGLPRGFARPPSQEIVELAAGGVRYVTFNLLVPRSFRGEASFWARAQETTGAQTQSEPAWFVVGGVSLVWSAALGVLALLAIAAIVVGTVLHLRTR
jgi:hypothetical protein